MTRRTSPLLRSPLGPSRRPAPLTTAIITTTAITHGPLLLKPTGAPSKQIPRVSLMAVPPRPRLVDLWDQQRRSGRLPRLPQRQLTRITTITTAASARVIRELPTRFRALHAAARDHLARLLALTRLPFRQPLLPSRRRACAVLGASGLFARLARRHPTSMTNPLTCSLPRPQLPLLLAPVARQQEAGGGARAGSAAAMGGPPTAPTKPRWEKARLPPCSHHSLAYPSGSTGVCECC